MSSGLSSQAILPTVRQVTVCHKLNWDEALGGWVVTAPYSVAFLSPEVIFPFRVPELAVYTQLVGGLGTIVFGVEIRQRMPLSDGTDCDSRVIGSYFDPESYVFLGGMNRLTVHELAFRLTDVPFRNEGTYEFRVIAQTPQGDVPLEGNVGAITTLAAIWRNTDV